MAIARRVYPQLADFFIYCGNADTDEPKDRDSRRMFAEIEKPFKINLRLTGHYTTRIAALASFGWSILADDKKNQKAADEAKMRCGALIRKIITTHAHTSFYGSTLHKLDLSKPNDRMRHVKIFSPMAYELFGDTIRFWDKKLGPEIALDESQDLLLDVHPFPFSGGILRTIMPTEILRYDSILEYANFLRKLKGLLQIINSGAGEDEQTAAETAAQNAVKHNVVITGKDLEFKLNTITSGNASGFKDFKELADRDISVACLGQANAAELPNNSGSRAAMQVLRMISADIFYQDMVRVEDLVRRVLLLDYRLNTSADATEVDIPYAFSFNLAEEKDIEKLANAIVTLAPYVPMKLAEVYAILGLTPPGPDDPIFKPISTGVPQ